MVYLINTAEQERSVEVGLFSTVKKFLTVFSLVPQKRIMIQFLEVSRVKTTENKKNLLCKVFRTLTDCSTKLQILKINK